MSGNSNLHSAKREKNNEFYTRIEDIINEVKHYENKFHGKIVFCNCDDPRKSKFTTYFANWFHHLKLKKLISTHYSKEGDSTKKLIWDGTDTNGDQILDINDMIEDNLDSNGDFRSPESLKLLKESDIIVSNPPFSLFREYIDTLIKSKKKFLVIGNKNAITYKEIFKLIKENKIWLGITSPKDFILPNGKLAGNMSGLTLWFTNISHSQRNEKLGLYKHYNGNEKHYPKYDNYDAINVDKTSEIPDDYDDEMGVPISFLTKYNPEQFEIVGAMTTTKVDEYNFGYPYINGNKIYARIIIKKNKNYE